MTDWPSLRDAYGSAERVPVLLVSAKETGAEHGGPWRELWGRLCHQGTSTAPATLRFPLARMSRQHAPAGYIPALYLAAVIASVDIEGNDDLARQFRRTHMPQP